MLCKYFEANKLQQAHKTRGTPLAALRQYAISTGRHYLVPSLFSLHPLIQTQGVTSRYNAVSRPVCENQQYLATRNQNRNTTKLR